MKKLLGLFAALIFPFLLLISAHASQPIKGNPIDWSNPETYVEFAPSKDLNEMETDSVLITFINSSTNSKYELIVRGKNFKTLVLESASKTFSDTKRDVSIVKGVSYKIKLEENTLAIVNPDGTYAAEFEIIEGFRNTDLFAYGKCKVYGNCRIELLNIENIISEVAIPNLSESLPSDGISVQPTTNSAVSTTEFPDDNTATDSHNNKKTNIPLILFIATIFIIILVVIIYMFNRSKKDKPTDNSLYSYDADSVEDIEVHNLDSDDDGVSIPSFIRSSESSYTPPPVSAPKDVPVSTPVSSPASTMFSEKNIMNRWSAVSDTGLTNYAEILFDASSSISVTPETAPTQMQYDETDTFDSAETIVSNETHSSVEYSAPSAEYEEYAPNPAKQAESHNESNQNNSSAGISAFSSIYFIDDAVDQIRNALGAYDAVQFADVTSNCVIDFSYGIFDNYNLSINASDYSSYIIVSEKLLLLNPLRFGKINNSIIDGYFLNKMHPEIPFDFFYGNNPVAANSIANSTIEQLVPAKVEKKDNVYVLVEKGKIFIRR